MPNVGALTTEAFTLFAMNHTYDWLKSKSPAEQREIVNKSRKDIKSLREKYKQRQAEIIEVRRQNLEAERQQKEKREKARLEDLKKLQKDLEKVGGLWTTDQEVDEGFAKLVTTPRNINKVKLDAIKTQINHRKKVLKQKFPTSCGFFSQNNVAFSLDEMIAKLKFVISLG